MPYTSVDKYEPITSKSQCHANELFAIGRDKNNEDYLPLNILNVQRKQKISWENIFQAHCINFVSGIRLIQARYWQGQDNMIL